MTDAAPSDREQRRRSFGPSAEEYDRGRPGYPAKAATWLTSDQPVSVLELGAGTGKLTEQLIALGHGVHATDPDRAMLDVLARRVPGALAKVGSAEKIEAPDNSFDVVVCGHSFHWFDAAEAIPEIVRVLKPGGRLSMVWNERDEQIPWVRKLGNILGTDDQSHDPTETLDSSLKFIMIEEQSFPHWQTIDRNSIRDLAASQSKIAVLDDEARQAKLEDVAEFYEGYGRGFDGMQLPWKAHCFRARVVKRRDPDPRSATPPASGTATAPAGDPGTDATTDPGPAPITDPPTPGDEGDGDDDGTLLIDFR